MASLGGKLPSMRSMYRSALDYRLIHADYSQQELWMMKCVSKDRALAEALATGDVYVADAKDIFGLPSHLTKCKCVGGLCLTPDRHVKPAARKQCKVGHLAFQFGCGLGKFYQQMLESDRTLRFSFCQLIFNRLRSRYSGTVDYWGEEMKRVERDGYSETRILRRRQVYPRRPPITEVANYPVQGTAADMTTLAMIRIRNRLIKEGLSKYAKLISIQHDAFDVHAHKDTVDHAKSIVIEEMIKPVEIDGEILNMKVDVKVARYWSKV